MRGGFSWHGDQSAQPGAGHWIRAGRGQISGRGASSSRQSRLELPQRQDIPPAIDGHGLTEQSVRDHPGWHQPLARVVMVAGLTPQAKLLSRMLGLGIQRGLDWFRGTQAPFARQYPSFLGIL